MKTPYEIHMERHPEIYRFEECSICSIKTFFSERRRVFNIFELNGTEYQLCPKCTQKVIDAIAAMKKNHEEEMSNKLQPGGGDLRDYDAPPSFLDVVDVIQCHRHVFRSNTPAVFRVAGLCGNFKIVRAIPREDAFVIILGREKVE